MKLNIKKMILQMILAILIVVFMTFIFSNSSKTGKESGQTSGSLSQEIAVIFIPDYRNFEEEKQNSITKKINKPLRELAHFVEFFLLSVSVYLFLYTFDIKKKKHIITIIITETFIIFYAFSDEFHQIFVDGRVFDFFDVFIDSAGGLCGIIIAVFIYKIAITIHKYLYERRKETD